MNHRRVTRVTLTDGSVIAELWIATTDACAYCGASGLWAPPQGNYCICVSCRRGWEPEHVPHTPADNEVLAQLISQLDKAQSM